MYYSLLMTKVFSLLIWYQFLSEFASKYYIPIILNMEKKKRCVYLPCMYSRLVIILLKLRPIAHRVKDPLVVKQFLKFPLLGYESCRSSGRWHSSAIDNKPVKIQLDPKPRQNVREICRLTGVSISPILDHLKKINNMKKLDKWVRHDLIERQRVRRFEVCSRLHLWNSNEAFLEQWLVDEKWSLYENYKW